MPVRRRIYGELRAVVAEGAGIGHFPPRMYGQACSGADCIASGLLDSFARSDRHHGRHACTRSRTGFAM
jgi:hypothetical protein